MLKCKVIKFSELDMCWSAERYVGACSHCRRVGDCKLPEAKKGRVVVAAKSAEKAWVAYRRAADRLEEAVDELS